MKIMYLILKNKNHRYFDIFFEFTVNMRRLRLKKGQDT